MDRLADRRELTRVGRSRSAPGPATAIAGRDGFVTVQFVAVAGLTLLLFVLLANVLVWSYARGVVRAALDEGARAGARAAEPEAECRSRAEGVLADLLGGAMAAEVSAVECADLGDRLVASVTARFRGWLPVLPDWTLQERALATRESTR